MKSFYLSLLIFLFLTSNLFSQNYGFDNGEIITNSNDTIRALVEFSPTYENFIRYKDSPDSKIQTIKIKDVSLLKTRFNTFKHFNTYKEQIMFRISIQGKISLWEFIKLNAGPSSQFQNQQAFRGTVVKYNPSMTYAIESGSDVFFIKQKKDVDQIRSLIIGCPDAKAIVESKSFKLEDLKDVINKLNNCNVTN